MIDAYIGLIGQPNGMLELEFETLREASEFCDMVMSHCKKDRKGLFVAMYTDDKGEENV